MNWTDLTLAAACALMLWLCCRLFIGCTVAAVSVDCPGPVVAIGEAGASP